MTIVRTRKAQSLQLRNPLWNLLLYFLVIAAITTGIYHLFNPDWILFHRGKELYDRGYYAEALLLFEQAKGLGIKTPRLSEHLAKCYLHENRGAEAKALILGQETNSINLSLSQVRLLAGAYQQMQQPELAVKTFFIFMQNGGILDAAAKLQFAGILRQAKNYQEAETYYHKIIAEDNTKARMARLELYEMLAWQGRYNEAINGLQELLDSNSDDHKARYLLAKIFTWSGHFHEAAIEYQKLLKKP